jgi:hypothetical protein
MTAEGTGAAVAAGGGGGADSGLGGNRCSSSGVGMR